MTDSATYSVVLSGSLKPGFEPDSVIEAFARLFKLSPEKAATIIGSRFVLKREVELRVAKTYKDRLAAIGVDVQLKRHGGIDELALEPVEAPQSSDGETIGADEMICPKCELRQQKAEECSACGVIVQKVLQRAAETGVGATPAPPAPDSAEPPAAADTAADSQPVGPKWVIAPLVVAVLGALLWYLVAARLDYEFGAIAWLIGGAVGFAAVSSGARGNAIGVICGALVLASICGGKYMAISAQQAELAAMLSSAIEYEGLELRDVYAEEVADARDFSKISSDADGLRRFMISHGYSEATEAAQVTEMEIEMFHEYTRPRLEDIAFNQPSFEEWQQYSLASLVEDLPTFAIMLGSLDWKDMLFLLFGVGTAFQLASRGRVAAR